MTISIYTAYHAPAAILESASVRPIHVGRAGNPAPPAPLAAMLGDAEGKSISERNPEYCELTALYWAWKNDRESAWLGLMHYRRLLDVTGAHVQSEVEALPTRLDIPAWLESAEAWLASSLEGYDIVLPKLHPMGRTMEDNYTARHAPGDWGIAREIIARDHPDYLASFERAAGERRVRLGNMMLMRRALADRYCAWLFDILFKLEAWDIDRSFYDPRQRRYLGFLAERLFTVFIDHVTAEDPGLRLHEVNIVNLKDAALFPTIADDRLNGPEHVNVAFAADSAYLAHTGAMLSSMLSHADPARQINLFFLATDVAPARRALLEEVVEGFPNAALTVIDVGGAFDGAYRSPSRSPSNATYNRFLLFDLLPGLERLLYVDVDMIFLGDVAEIFDADMEGAPLAAVTDYIMTRVLTGPTPTVDPNVPDLYRYYSADLGMRDAEIARYFNAGILLFDFSAMDVAEEGRAMTRMAREGRYLFRDQDILNLQFRGRTHQLPGRYNVFNTVRAGYGRVPQENFAAAMEAKKDPFVIHYAAGDYKPWNRAVPLGQHYWQALAETPFYPEILARLARRSAPREAENAPRRMLLARDGWLVRRGRALSERVPGLRPALLSTYRGLQRLLT